MNPDRSKIPAALGEFGEQLAISEILNSQQIEELNEKIESGRWPIGARELASRLFYEKWLTEFQARKLIANRASELIVGRYLIVDRIGGGAMGDVFKAEHQYMGRIVALSGSRARRKATVQFVAESEQRKVLLTCLATIGVTSNSEHSNKSLGKAGESRWLGRRPKVRGVAMNPVDHPHGGGEGRTSGGRHPVTPWGFPTKRKKTRKNKSTTKFILASRHTRKK